MIGQKRSVLRFQELNHNRKGSEMAPSSFKENDHERRFKKDDY